MSEIETMYPPSFIPQCLHRTQASRAFGGVDTKEKTCAHGHDDGEEDGGEAEDEGEGPEEARGEAGEEPADTTAKHDADDASGDGECYGLAQKLEQNIAAARADGFAQADLACALGDGDEHDVHDADSADEQTDARDKREENGEAERDGVDNTGDLVGPASDEVVFDRIVLGILDVMPLAQQERDV